MMPSNTMQNAATINKSTECKFTAEQSQKLHSTIQWRDVQGSDRVTERKIAYFSEFELNINDWKYEAECLVLHEKELQKNLGTFK
jgi:hypothetical protein